MFIEYIDRELNQRKQLGLFRRLKISQNSHDFASNDFLGIAKHCYRPSTTFGNAASRLVSGNSLAIESLEQSIADFHQVEEALLFSSGYLANLGLCSAIGKRTVNFIFDELVHASIRDGLRLSHARCFKFRHNDLRNLEARLSEIKAGEVFVVVESLYSMQGDFSDLPAIQQLCLQYNAHLIVDEAHSVGVYGKYGAGLCNHYGIEKDVFARVVTYGKAFGCQGAAILCSSQVKDYLINFSRPFIYTTAMAPCLVELIKQSYQLVADASEERAKLISLIDYFDKRSDQLNLKFLAQNSAIKFITIVGNENARRVSSKLNQSDFSVWPILSPTVQSGSEGLRIVLHSYNSETDVDNLLNSIVSSSSELISKLPITPTAPQ